MSERPSAILRAERLFFLGLALGLLYVVANATEDGLSGVAMVHRALTASVVLVLLTGVALMVTRRRSRIALAVLMLMFVSGIPVFVQFLAAPPFTWSDAIMLPHTAVQAAAIVLVVTKPGWAWLMAGAPKR